MPENFVYVVLEEFVEDTYIVGVYTDREEAGEVAADIQVAREKYWKSRTAICPCYLHVVGVPLNKASTEPYGWDPD